MPSEAALERGRKRVQRARKRARERVRESKKHTERAKRARADRKLIRERAPARIERAQQFIDFAESTLAQFPDESSGAYRSSERAMEREVRRSGGDVETWSIAHKNTNDKRGGWRKAVQRLKDAAKEAKKAAKKLKKTGDAGSRGIHDELENAARAEREAWRAYLQALFEEQQRLYMGYVECSEDAVDWCLGKSAMHGFCAEAGCEDDMCRCRLLTTDDKPWEEKLQQGVRGKLAQEAKKSAVPKGQRPAKPPDPDEEVEKKPPATSDGPSAGGTRPERRREEDAPTAPKKRLGGGLWGLKSGQGGGGNVRTPGDDLVPVGPDGLVPESDFGDAANAAKVKAARDQRLARQRQRQAREVAAETVSIATKKKVTAGELKGRNVWDQEAKTWRIPKKGEGEKSVHDIRWPKDYDPKKDQKKRPPKLTFITPGGVVAHTEDEKVIERVWKQLAGTRSVVRIDGIAVVPDLAATIAQQVLLGLRVPVYHGSSAPPKPPCELSGGSFGDGVYSFFEGVVLLGASVVGAVGSYAESDETLAQGITHWANKIASTKGKISRGQATLYKAALATLVAAKDPTDFAAQTVTGVLASGLYLFDLLCRMLNGDAKAWGEFAGAFGAGVVVKAAAKGVSRGGRGASGGAAKTPKTPTPKTPETPAASRVTAAPKGPGPVEVPKTRTPKTPEAPRTQSGTTTTPPEPGPTKVPKTPTPKTPSGTRAPPDPGPSRVPKTPRERGTAAQPESAPPPPGPRKTEAGAAGTRVGRRTGEGQAKSKYHRPYLRKGVRDEVMRRAPKTLDGRPIDPNTRKPIDGKPELGHKPGHEFWREAEKAKRQGLSQKEFNDRMNNPDLYQLEDPSSNRSHRFEQPR